MEFCRILVELELPLMKTFILNATEVSSLGPFIDYWHFFQSKETNSPCSLKGFQNITAQKSYGIDMFDKTWNIITAGTQRDEIIQEKRSCCALSCK